MTSSTKFYLLVGILSLVVVVFSFGVSAKGANSSTISLIEIVGDQKENTSNEWWVYIVLSIDDTYWGNIESHSLTVNIDGQTYEMTLDQNYEVASPDHRAFVTSISGLESNNYNVLIQWNDQITPKVWTGQELGLGELNTGSELIDLFHQVAPTILMVSILGLTVIFPGKKKYTNHSSQVEQVKNQEAF